MCCFSAKGPENEVKNMILTGIIHSQVLYMVPSWLEKHQHHIWLSHISTYASQKQYSFVSIITPHCHSYYHTAINKFQAKHG